ncbi:O-methyltransferase [Miniphocaeibacter massiliensis]|uniref:O-methyltransferase n=1 Tax=Miniphocaeibacter massiliensis TaxID=2041841 RepID=UPI000C07D2DB|nr:O-methyltransferase [Miniphocaeibacter massiliensis]
MIVEENVEKYIRTISKTNNNDLLEMEKYAFNNKIPIIEPEVRNFLDVIVRIKKPKKILEIGTAIGYSAIVMKLANENSKITTIEINEENFLKAKENVEKIGFNKDIHCILGDANDVLDLLEEKYDLIFMDAAKGQYINYFEKSIDKLDIDGILISDNILFKGMVATEEYKKNRHRKITIVKRLDQYIELLMNDEKLCTSIIPIDDGMSITYRKH